MTNLIHNSEWLPGPDGCRKYFSGFGFTYDKLCINGFRTCSVTQEAGCRQEAADCYDLAIDVRGQEVLNYGYVIRAVELCSLILVVEFFDDCGCFIRKDRQQAANQVDYQFNRITVCFRVPEKAKAARLRMEFHGKVTACTYYAPTAYFCG